MKLFWLIITLIASTVLFNFLLRKLSEESRFMRFVNGISNTAWVTVDVIMIMAGYIIYFETKLLEHPLIGILCMMAAGLYVAVLNVRKPE